MMLVCLSFVSFFFCLLLNKKSVKKKKTLAMTIFLCMYSCTCTLNINTLIQKNLQYLIFRCLRLYSKNNSMEPSALQLRFSSRPRAEVRTQLSPGAGESKACNPTSFIRNFYYLFGFQFRVILPFSSQQVSQVRTVVLLVMQWMEIGVQTSTSVHTLRKTTILGGEQTWSEQSLQLK